MKPQQRSASGLASIINLDFQKKGFVSEINPFSDYGNASSWHDTLERGNEEWAVQSSYQTIFGEYFWNALAEELFSVGSCSSAEWPGTSARSSWVIWPESAEISQETDWLTNIRIFGLTIWEHTLSLTFKKTLKLKISKKIAQHLALFLQNCGKVGE